MITDCSGRLYKCLQIKSLCMLFITDNRNNLVNKGKGKVMDRLVITLPSATSAEREVRTGRLWGFTAAEINS